MNRALRPDGAEVRAVVGLTGRVLIVAGALHVPAILLSLVLSQWRDATAMTVGAAVAVILGAIASRGTRSNPALRWSSGMVSVALAWLVTPAAIAVSLHLTGATGSLLDALFDAMSGLTTSGLSLLQDVDHLGEGVQLLRHLSHFMGGQGVILVVLTVVEQTGSQVGTLLVGEGRDERIVPNVVRTARLIYLIAAAWALVGTLTLWVTMRLDGFEPARALAHASNLFMAAFDTGGFSMMSTSVAYYHSGGVEIVLVVLMIAGGISFPLHWALWQRRVSEARSHLDLRTFVVTTTVLSGVLMLGLAAHHVYEGAIPLLRKGGFTAISAATGTGFTVVAGPTYLQWGQLAPAMVVLIMSLGAMAGSTAGGVKSLRVGILIKAITRDVRAALAPASARVEATYTLRRRLRITDAMVRATVVTVTLFLLTYLGGAMIAMLDGASLETALFESVSATAAVGLSTGVANPGASALLKTTLIVQMWLGRLEFMAAFALVAWTGAVTAGWMSRTQPT